MKCGQLLKVLSLSILLVGCNSSSENTEKSTTDSSVSQNSSVKLPNGYSHKVINNKGDAVEGQVGEYTVRMVANYEENADPRAIHKGVVVNIDGVESKVIPIQISYLNKSIIVSVYNKKDELIAVTDVVEITDVPVVLVKLSIN